MDTEATVGTKVIFLFEVIFEFDRGEARRNVLHLFTVGIFTIDEIGPPNINGKPIPGKADLSFTGKVPPVGVFRKPVTPDRLVFGVKLAFMVICLQCSVQSS